MDAWLFHAHKSGDPKIKSGGRNQSDSRDQKTKENKNRPKKSQGSGGDIPNDIAEHLQHLGLARKVDKQWYIQNEFTSMLSASKSGLAFAAIGSPSVRLEAIIPHADRGGALHRDWVRVRVTGFGRGRFTAKVLAVTQPFAGEYLARVLNRAQTQGSGKGKESLRLAELIDLPDRPHVLVRGQVKPGDVVYLNRTDATSEFLREHPQGGYNRSQAFVFEKSPRKISEDRKGDLERLRLRYMLPENFPATLIPKKKTLEALAKKEFKNPQRIHVKDRFIFTIDGEDAKDFDDAISVKETSSGFELDVHIADVGFFVPPGSPLFTEALKRGNSYYLAGSVIPMLPEILSNEFCSLKPKTTRLAFSARMQFDAHGSMRDYELFKSVIYIDKRFTYKDAHKSIAGKKSPLAAAMKLANVLIKRRDSDGRIDLNIAEQKPVYDKKGRFVGLESQARLDSHRLVEECMLSANQAIANYALKHNLGILHRNHESMAKDKVERLNRYLEKYAGRLKIREADQKEIGRVLKDRALDKVRDVFQILLLRSFMQANYMPEGRGHWGLAFGEYAHFTSPIRRFADLVTHIELAAHLRRERSSFSPGELDHYGREASRLERIAFEAERADKKLLAVRAMKGKVGQVFGAWLSGFSSERLFISLSDFPVEGEIEAMDVDRRGEIKSIDDFSVFAGKLQKTLSLGDKFRVKLVSADPLEMALKFEFAKS